MWIDGEEEDENLAVEAQEDRNNPQGYIILA